MSDGVKSKKKVVIVVISALIFLLLAGGGAWLLFSRTSNHSPFSKKFVSSVSFPLYYPDPLPEGYKLKPNSIGGDGKIVYYILMNNTLRRSITISLYATPQDFDAAKVFKDASIPSSIIPAGTMYNFGLGDTSKYMIDTKAGTLIYINSPKSTPLNDISNVANSLQKVRQ